MNKAKIRGAVCPSCGRDNSEHGNICTSDDCPGRVEPYATMSPRMAAWLDPDGGLQAAGLVKVQPSREDYTKTLSAKLRERGIPHSPAQYDALGKCLTCGEAGRCPGIHTFEKIQAAGRAR